MPCPGHTCDQDTWNMADVISGPQAVRNIRVCLFLFFRKLHLFYIEHGKKRFTVVHMENHTRINCVSSTHNCTTIFNPAGIKDCPLC